MAGRKLNKIVNKCHPWDLKWSDYLIIINVKIQKAILPDATGFDPLYFATYIMATRSIILLTSVFPPTCVTSILTKLRSKLKIICSRDTKSTRGNLYQIRIHSCVFWPSKLCVASCSLDRFFACLWTADLTSSWKRPSNTKPCRNAPWEVRISRSSRQMQHSGSATGEKQVSIRPTTVKPT